VGKIAEKAVCRSVDNMALYFECLINKNALFQTVFLAVFPTGLYDYTIFYDRNAYVSITWFKLATVISKT